MNRSCIFLGSLVLTAVTISFACNAGLVDWPRALLASSTAGGGGASGSAGHLGAGWLAVTPATLISVEGIGL